MLVKMLKIINDSLTFHSTSIAQAAASTKRAHQAEGHLINYEEQN